MQDIEFRVWYVNHSRFLNEDEIHTILPYFSGYSLLNHDPHTFVLETHTSDIGDDGDEDKIEEIKWLRYTGLNDKNDKMIFEGDILCDPIGKAYKITVNNDHGYRFMCGKDILNKWHSQGEVIGNYLENPELME